MNVDRPPYLLNIGECIYWVYYGDTSNINHTLVGAGDPPHHACSAPAQRVWEFPKIGDPNKVP